MRKKILFIVTFAIENTKHNTHTHNDIPEMNKKKNLRVNIMNTFAPRMPVKDSIKMSFWEKFIKYRRFPFKFVVHLLLLIFVTIQVFLLSNQRAAYLYSTGKTIFNTFLPSDFETLIESKNGHTTYSFYKVNDAIEHVEQVVKNVCISMLLCHIYFSFSSVFQHID